MRAGAETSSALRRYLGNAVAAIAFATAAAPQAFAQVEDNGEEAPDSGASAASVARDELIVTARRRSENLYDVPGAVSAFGEQQVRDLQATDMRRIQYAVPNFHFERSDSSNAAVYLRGIGQNDSLPFVEPGVGIYIDDVYVARSQAAFIELFDVERVEVLRGPQGTLYGRNSTGGAVKLVTRRPSDEPEAYLELGTGNFSLATVNARVSGPLNDDASLKGKIAVTATHRNGFSKNVVEGGHDGDTALFAWRGALAYEPGDAIEISLGFDGKIERPERSLTPIRKTSLKAYPDPVGDPINFVVFQPTEAAFGSPYVVEGTANDFADLTTYGVTLKGRWSFAENWAVESISSYRGLSWDFLLDSDDTPFSVLDIPVFEDDDQYTSELRLAFDDANGLAFTIGAYYFHDFDVVLSGFDDRSAPFEFGGFVFPIISFGVPTSGYGESRQRTDAIAAFADITFPIGSATSLEFGLRYSYEEKEVERRGEFFFDPTLTLSFDRSPFLAGVGFPSPLLIGKENWDALTPRAVLSHHLSDQTMVYASAARGFKSGGFPGRAFGVTDFVPFSPEKVWTYEGGLKFRRDDGRLGISAAYFYSDYKDIQLNGFGQDPNTGQFVSLFTNAASSRIQGVEASLSFRPFENLVIDGSAGYLDAEYKEFDTLVNGVMTDVSDRRFPNSPRWTGFLGATLVKPVGNNLAATLHIDAAYRGAHANETTDSPNLNVPEVVYLNAFASIGAESGRWGLRAGGTNLTDKARAAQSFNTSEFSGVENAFMAPPRLYDVRLILRF